MWSSMNNPDIRDEDVVAELKIVILRSGAMGVMGSIGDEKYAVACLEQAIQSVKDHHRRLRGDGSMLITPSYDTPLAN
jgi:hypothetical protein